MINRLTTDPFHHIFQGPYDLIFRQINECTDAGTREVVMNAKIKKLNRETTAIDGNMTLKIPFNDDITVNII